MATNLEQGACETQHVPRSRGLLSPDVTRTESFSASDHLLICDAVTGDVLQQWSLPAGLVPHRAAGAYAWDCSGSHLSMLFGRAWSGGFEDSVDDDSDSEDTAGTGLLFLDCESGQTKAVHLPDQGAGTMLSANFCPGQGLVAVCHLDSDAEHVYSIFGCQGTLVASTPTPDAELTATNFAWCPRSEALLMRSVTNDFQLWLWHFMRPGAPVSVSAAPDMYLDFDPYSEAWQIPYTGALLLGVCNRSGASDLLALSDSPAPYRLVPLPPEQAVGYAMAAAWGTRLALLAHSSLGGGCDQLQLYRFAGGQPALQQVVTLGQRRFDGRNIEVSPDGELAATLTHLPPNRWTKLKRCLAVVGLETGRVFELPLPQSVQDASSAEDDVRLQGWSPDGTAIVLSVRSGPSWVCRLDT